MRSFEFKVFNKKTNLWIHQRPCNLLGEIILLGGWMNGIRLEDFDDVVIMQGTGLFDRKNVKIFECDIVKADNYNPEFFIVKFIDGGFCCTYENDCIPIDINHFYPSVGCQLEVVGNIFDNLDLKEKKINSK